MYYVYIISNKQKGIYIGYTSDLRRRFKEHTRPNKGYTNGTEWELIYYEAYKSKEDAMERERKLKHHGQAKRWLKERIKRSLGE